MAETLQHDANSLSAYGSSTCLQSKRPPTNCNRAEEYPRPQLRRCEWTVPGECDSAFDPTDSVQKPDETGFFRA